MIHYVANLASDGFLFGDSKGPWAMEVFIEELKERTGKVFGNKLLSFYSHDRAEAHSSLKAGESGE
jgi:hypothetical protein